MTRGVKPGRVAETVPVVKAGDYDPMTALRRRHGMPPCRTSNLCTRSAGHDESDGHPAALHVNADPHGIAREVWK